MREYVKTDTERTAFVPEMKGPWVYLTTLKRNEREKLKYSSKLFIHSCFQNTWISFSKWKNHEQRPTNQDFVQRTYKWSRLSEQHCLNKGYFIFSFCLFQNRWGMFANTSVLWHRTEKRAPAFSPSPPPYLCNGSLWEKQRIACGFVLVAVALLPRVPQHKD